MTASIGVSGDVLTLTGDAGETAIAESEITTTETDVAVSFKFAVGRRAVVLRVGTTTGGQDIVQAVSFAPGDHVLTFTPGVSPYYLRFELADAGVATVTGFARVAPGTLELPTPWAEAALASLRCAQSLNTLWFVGGGAETHVLERRGTNTWSLRPFRPSDGPFTALNSTETTLTASAQTGQITVTSSAPLFVASDVGALLQFVHSGQFVSASLSAVDAVSDPIEVTGVESFRQFQISVTGTFVGTVLLERSIGNTTNWQTVNTYTGVTATTYNDDLDNQVVYYRFRMSAYTSGAAVSALTYSAGVTQGSARIVTVTADNSVTADVIQPLGDTSATALWAFGAWSERYGYPAAIALFDGRLWFLRGNAYWGSVSDHFTQFAIGPLASDAIGRTFGGPLASVRWAVGSSRLLVGLSGFESEIGSNSFDEVLKPENVRARNKTTRGSADTAAVLVDEAALFVNRSRQRVYRYGYSNQIGDMATIDMTRMHREIASTGGFVELSWQQEPEPRLWCVRADGEVAVLVFDQEEGVVAWCRLVTDGVVESVCCLPTDTAEDEVYLVVRRTVNSATVRHVERVAPEAWSSLQEAWRLHDGLSYSGTATTTLSGLGHLEARSDVYVWANGRELGPFTVSSGSITLPQSVTYAIAGLKYEGRYKSGRLAWGAQMGASLIANKQLEKVGVVIHRTAGGALRWGDSFSDMERLDDRINDGTLVFDAAVQLWSGDFEFNVHGWTDRDTRLCISMDTAGPATVLAVVETMKVNG